MSFFFEGTKKLTNKATLWYVPLSLKNVDKVLEVPPVVVRRPCPLFPGRGQGGPSLRRFRGIGGGTSLHTEKARAAGLGPADTRPPLEGPGQRQDGQQNCAGGQSRGDHSPGETG